MFAGNFAPVGWAFCQGQLLPISENDVLFTLIGTTYGGDGQTTFALPNLQGRVPLHAGNNGANFVIGQIGGTESVTLTTSQLPSHSHVPVCATAGSVVSPSGAVLATATSAQAGVQVYSDQAPDTPLAAGTVAASGGSQPHDNMIPFLVVNFIISLFGIFPSQS
jgi:microcystin-dependent protein